MMTAFWMRFNAAMLVLVFFALVAVIALLAGGAQGGPLDPDGPPGSTSGINLPGTPISSAPYVITASGYYYLTDDLQVTGGGTGITIDGFVKNVTIDLNGFTIYGQGQSLSAGIRAVGPSPPAQYPIRIKNGTINNVSTGVHVAAAAHVRIDDVYVFNTGDGFVLGNHAVLSNCTAANSTGSGINIVGAFVVVRNCMVIDGADGIRVQGSDNVIEDSQILRNGSRSIRVLYGSDDNIVRGNALYSVELEQNSAYNTVHGNTLCIVPNSGLSNRIVNNVLRPSTVCVGEYTP